MDRLFTVIMGVLFFLSGAFVFSFTGRSFRETRNFLAISQTAPGRVVKLEGNDARGYSPVISFETPDGQERSFTRDYAAASFLSPKVGQSVEVLYDPAHPSRARVSGFFSLWSEALIIGVMGIVFMGSGAWLLFGTFRAPRGRRRSATAVQAPAVEAKRETGEPWSSRPDWAQGRIESSTGLAGKWAFAILWNLLTWPAAYFIWRGITDGGREPLSAALRPENWPVLIFLIFVVIAVVSLARALLRTYEAARSGRSVFVMSAVPGVVGGSLEGVIHGHLRLRDDQGIRLHLTSSVRSVRQSGNRTSMRTSVGWEDDRAIPATQVTQSADEALIPVHMTIPATCRETAKRVEPPQGQLGDLIVRSGPGEYDSVSWTLEARAEPAHAWRAEFEVPVFRTRASAAPPPELRARGVAAMRSMSLGQMARVGEELQQTAEAVAGPTPRPFDSRVVVRPSTAEGVLIEYPAAFLFVAFAGWWLLTLPLYVVLPLDLLRLKLMGPVASLAVAAVLNGLPGYLMVYYWPRRLLIGPETVTVFCGLPFFGARRRLPTAEAGKVLVDPDRLAILRKGETSLLRRYFFVAPPLASHDEARWLAAEIEKALAAYR
jgi:hypothetical protein